MRQTPSSPLMLYDAPSKKNISKNCPHVIHVIGSGLRTLCHSFPINIFPHDVFPMQFSCRAVRRVRVVIRTSGRQRGSFVCSSVWVCERIIISVIG